MTNPPIFGQGKKVLKLQFYTGRLFTFLCNFLVLSCLISDNYYCSISMQSGVVGVLTTYKSYFHSELKCNSKQLTILRAQPATPKRYVLHPAVHWGGGERPKEKQEVSKRRFYLLLTKPCGSPQREKEQGAPGQRG